MKSIVNRAMQQSSLFDDGYENTSRINKTLHQILIGKETDVLEHFVNEFGGIINNVIETKKIIDAYQPYSNSSYTGSNRYYYRRGTAPYYLIAHVDSWQSDNPQLMQYRMTNKRHTGYVYSEHLTFIPWQDTETVHIIQNDTGILGADDRAGVYAIYHLLKNHRMDAHILLTSGEEVGGLGVHQFLQDYGVRHFEGIECFIELDMYGMNYCAMHGCESVNKQSLNRYKAFWQDHDWAFSEGGFTDVTVLSRATHIPNMNFSVCYLNQHTEKEYLNATLLAHNIERFEKMFSALGFCHELA